jgi:hypothetical protein
MILDNSFLVDKAIRPFKKNNSRNLTFLHLIL